MHANMVKVILYVYVCVFKSLSKGMTQKWHTFVTWKHQTTKKAKKCIFSWVIICQDKTWEFCLLKEEENGYWWTTSFLCYKNGLNFLCNTITKKHSTKYENTAFCSPGHLCKSHAITLHKHKQEKSHNVFTNFLKMIMFFSELFLLIQFHSGCLLLGIISHLHWFCCCPLGLFFVPVHFFSSLSSVFVLWSSWHY